MIVLALEGALGGFSSAVVRDADTLAERATDQQLALERGLQAVAQTLEAAELRAEDLDRVAVGVGPGRFTGARIAISYAKSLAQAWHLPLVGISSFDILQYGIAAELPLLTVVRGRPGVVSLQLKAGGETLRASGYVADAIAEIAGGVPRRLTVAGTAEDVLAALAERGIDVQYPSRPFECPAAIAAKLGAVREPARSAHEVRADYGELPAVTPKKNG